MRLASAPYTSLSLMSYQMFPFDKVLFFLNAHSSISWYVRQHQITVTGSSVHTI